MRCWLAPQRQPWVVGRGHNPQMIAFLAPRTEGGKLAAGEEAAEVGHRVGWGKAITVRRRA